MFGIEKAPDDAGVLAERLQKCSTVDAFHKLRQAMEDRRNWIRMRRGLIDGAPGFEGAERLKATAKGPAALQALDKEIEQLAFELSFLDRLEQLAVTGSTEADIAEWRREIPQAIKRQGAEVKAVRTALAALDAALEKLNASLATVGHFRDAGVDFPVPSVAVQELLSLRESVWQPRNVALILPPEPQDDAKLREHVQEFPLAYHRRGGGVAEFKYTLRRPPAFPRAFADHL